MQKLAPDGVFDHFKSQKLSPGHGNMANDHIGVLSHPGQPLATVGTPKDADPC